VSADTDLFASNVSIDGGRTSSCVNGAIGSMVSEAAPGWCPRTGGSIALPTASRGAPACRFGVPSLSALSYAPDGGESASRMPVGDSMSLGESALSTAEGVAITAGETESASPGRGIADTACEGVSHSVLRSARLNATAMVRLDAADESSAPRSRDVRSWCARDASSTRAALHVRLSRRVRWRWSDARGGEARRVERAHTTDCSVSEGGSLGSVWSRASWEREDERAKREQRRHTATRHQTRNNTSTMQVT
jgi:hypothetical protein